MITTGFLRHLVRSFLSAFHSGKVQIKKPAPLKVSGKQRIRHLPKEFFG
jgi:hypothetical protein